MWIGITQGKHTEMGRGGCHLGDPQRGQQQGWVGALTSDDRRGVLETPSIQQRGGRVLRKFGFRVWKTDTEKDSAMDGDNGSE